MEGPTYKGREGREKREREVPPVIMVPPRTWGARIVTDQYSSYEGFVKQAVLPVYSAAATIAPASCKS